MKIIIVATKQASKFLSNRGDLGPTGKHSVAFGDIVKGELDAGPLVWNGERWVVASHNVLIHSPQITSKDEAESLVARLQSDGKYETAIIGCDHGNTVIQLAHKLREVFGSENVTEVYPNLDKGFSQYRKLRIRIKELLGQIAVERAETGTEGTKGTVKKQARHLKVTLADTENVINIIFDEGTHLELDFRDGTGETA